MSRFNWWTSDDGALDVDAAVEAIQNTGCDHIQSVIEGMSYDDLRDLVDTGAADIVLSTIESGNEGGYQAASHR